MITPSAALSRFLYAPDEAMRALRYFVTKPRHRIWGRFGFVGAFCENQNWYARTYLAINQGPIVIMMENFRSGLLWRLFMGAGGPSEPVEAGIRKPASERGHWIRYAKRRTP